MIDKLNGVFNESVGLSVRSRRRFVRDTFMFVDKERVAVWGKGYGGYLATKALSDLSGVFTCGAAVAAVSDWRYHSKYRRRQSLSLASSSTG